MSTSIVPIEHSSQLTKLDQARQMLAECRTLTEVKKVKDIAESAKIYARTAHLGRESQNYAAAMEVLSQHPRTTRGGYSQAVRQRAEIAAHIAARDSIRFTADTHYSEAQVEEIARPLRDNIWILL